jgi:predicted DNA binding CopG/RHH family protein
MEEKKKQSTQMFVIRLSKENLDIKHKIKEKAEEEGLTVNAYMNDILHKFIYGS